MNEKLQAVLDLIPEEQRAAATAILVKYGQVLLAMGKDDVRELLKRLQAGDYAAMEDLDAQLSDEDFEAEVKANSARWDSVAETNANRKQAAEDFFRQSAGVFISVLTGLVGL